MKRIKAILNTEIHLASALIIIGGMTVWFIVIIGMWPVQPPN